MACKWQSGLEQKSKASFFIKYDCRNVFLPLQTVPCPHQPNRGICAIPHSCKYKRLANRIRNIEGSMRYLTFFDYSFAQKSQLGSVCSQTFVVQVNTNNPAMCCKKLRKFILQFPWRKKTQLEAVMQYKVGKKKLQYQQMRKRRKEKQVLDQSHCCKGTLFYEATSRLSPCREKKK